MSDLIKPPAARLPEETLELVSQALSDGDLEAALAQYENPALVAHWPRWRPVEDGSDVRGALDSFMALRLPLSVRITMVLRTPELALVICDRQVAGTGPDGEQVRAAGRGCAVVRPQPDGTWRIAADAWHLGHGAPPDPPAVPPEAGRDAVPGEGHDPRPGACPGTAKPRSSGRSTTVRSGSRSLSIIPL